MNFLYWRHWEGGYFGDGIHVDGNLGFGILDCYRLEYNRVAAISCLAVLFWSLENVTFRLVDDGRNHF